MLQSFVCELQGLQTSDKVEKLVIHDGEMSITKNWEIYSNSFGFQFDEKHRVGRTKPCGGLQCGPRVAHVWLRTFIWHWIVKPYST